MNVLEHIKYWSTYFRRDITLPSYRSRTPNDDPVDQELLDVIDELMSENGGRPVSLYQIHRRIKQEWNDAFETLIDDGQLYLDARGRIHLADDDHRASS